MLNKVRGYRLGVISLVIFLTLAQTGCFAQQLGREQRPKENNPYTWDFGQVEEGEVLKHDFVLKNDSQDTLNIKDISTSCGCTVSSVKQEMLLPGESTLIEVKFNSKGYSGAVQQFIYVYTDDLDNPITRYIIKVEVVK